MTTIELRAEVARRRALGHEAIVLVVDRVCRGARARVIPGVLGRVVGCTSDGNGTILDVRLDDLESALERIQ